jgi:hypothetical protein
MAGSTSWRPIGGATRAIRSRSHGRSGVLPRLRRRRVLRAARAFHDPDSGRIVPWQDYETVTRSLPFVRATLRTFRAYAEAGIPEILGAATNGLAEAAMDTLDLMVFLNRGGRFEGVALPIEAQFAPAFGVAVSDFNGDGRRTSSSRRTSSVSRGNLALRRRGLWLEGDGRGRFAGVPSRRSGIRILGEQRGCAVADYDADGRPDLAVGQNHGPTKLYRNLRGRPECASAAGGTATATVWAPFSASSLAGASGRLAKSMPAAVTGRRTRSPRSWPSRRRDRSSSLAGAPGPARCCRRSARNPHRVSAGRLVASD